MSTTCIRRRTKNLITKGCLFPMQFFMHHDKVKKKFFLFLNSKDPIMITLEGVGEGILRGLFSAT